MYTISTLNLIHFESVSFILIIQYSVTVFDYAFSNSSIIETQCGESFKCQLVGEGGGLGLS